MSTVYSVGDYRISERVLAAVEQASRTTGVDFRYMMAKAAQESAFRPDAVAATTSATGLYQFISSTWLQMVNDHGARHGLGRYADQIIERVDGSLSVPNRAMRDEILALRTDPRLNALMAAEFARDNRTHLQAHTAGPVGPTELYLAHFLGARGATSFLNGLKDNPHQSAAALFPAAARANRTVFYDRATGGAKSLGEVYAWAERRMTHGMSLIDGSTAAGAATAGRNMLMAPHFAATRPLSAIPRPTAIAAFLPGAAWQSQVAALARNQPGTATPAGAGSRGLEMWTMLTASALPIPGDGAPSGRL